jgi:VIT1/CCC1 family predicted Fe2+/Mn2+ transporter
MSPNFPYIHPMEKHFKSPQTVTDIVLGMSDGLTVPFALSAGLSSALGDNHLITTAGIAEIVAGCIAMGLGGYLAGKTEAEHYDSELQREYQEVESMPEKEEAEIKEILAEYNISPSVQDTFVKDLQKDKTKYVEFMMRFELGLERPDDNAALKSGIIIGLAYVVGGMIPLSSYFFTSTPYQGLFYSCIITATVLFIFGFIKSKVIGQNPIKGALRVLIVSALAAGAAYYIASLFG